MCGLHCRRKTSHFTSTRQVNLRARYPANSNDSTYIQSKITLKTLDGGFLKFIETLLQWYLLYFVYLFSFIFMYCMEWKIQIQVVFSFLYYFLSPFSPWSDYTSYITNHERFFFSFFSFFYLLSQRLSSVTNYLFLTLFSTVYSHPLSHNFFKWFVLCCCFVLSLQFQTTMVIHSFLTRNYERPMKSFWRFACFIFWRNILHQTFFLFHCIRRLHATKMMKWLQMDWKGANIFSIQYNYRYIYIYLWIFLLYHTNTKDWCF